MMLQIGTPSDCVETLIGAIIWYFAHNIDTFT